MIDTLQIVFFHASKSWRLFYVFFFQAVDGIRGFHVTGVQTCALPISPLSESPECSRGSWIARERHVEIVARRSIMTKTWRHTREPRSRGSSMAGGWRRHSR